LFNAVWAYNTESKVILMIAMVNLHVAALALLSQNWYRIPLTVLMTVSGIALVSITVYLAVQIHKAVFPRDDDPFIVFAKVLFTFYVGLVLVMEVVGVGMSIASILGVYF